MHETSIDGVIRKIWIDRPGPYRDHLLRLDKESRRNRFGGAVADEFIENYAELSRGLDCVMHGYFVDGTLRGVAELRPLGKEFAQEAEASLGEQARIEASDRLSFDEYLRAWFAA